MKEGELDAVEIKVTIRPDQELQALRELKLDEDSAEVRVIYYYDTIALDLFNSGLALRARLVKGDADDSTVKRRPIEAASLPPEWRKIKGFKLEADAVGNKVVCSASLTALQKRDEIDQVAEEKRPIEKLFSKDQKRFIEELHPTPVDFSTLKVLGPIRVLRWQTKHKKFPYDLTTEEWRLPDGTDLLETSIKVTPADAEEAGRHFAAHLQQIGLDPEGAQETKTRTALEFFVRQKT